MSSKAVGSLAKTCASVEDAHAERAEAVGVAHGDELVRGEEEHREGALHLPSASTMRSTFVLPRAARDEVDHDLGVARALEDRARASSLALASSKFVKLPLCATAIEPPRSRRRAAARS
jgi:hypothetical protein